jgi:hypothetical protein
MNTINEARKKPVSKKGKKAKFDKVMGEWKKGKLRSGSKTGKKVTSQKQALAIAFSESGQSKNESYVPDYAKYVNDFLNEKYK